VINCWTTCVCKNIKNKKKNANDVSKIGRDAFENGFCWSASFSHRIKVKIVGTFWVSHLSSNVFRQLLKMEILSSSVFRQLLKIAILSSNVFRQLLKIAILSSSVFRQLLKIAILSSNVFRQILKTAISRRSSMSECVYSKPYWDLLSWVTAKRLCSECVSFRSYSDCFLRVSSVLAGESQVG
jgi:hypothetical protein